jgi:hypothetical protein
LGAGLASAALFALQAKGGVGPGFVGLFAPLPLMIVAMAHGERLALLAAAVGLGLAFTQFDAVICGLFAASVELPACFLGALAAREKRGTPGALLLACVCFAVALVWIVLAVEAWNADSLDAAIGDIAAKLTPAAGKMIDASAGAFADEDAGALAQMLALALMPVAAVWGVVGFALNLWLAGRAAAISGLLARPWPDLPSTLRLPRAAFAGVGLAGAACLLPSPTRLWAACALSALMAGYGLAGLAALHGVTRGRAGRPALLCGFYALCVALFPLPLVVMAGLGLADSARPMTRNARLQPNPNPPRN